MELLKFQSKISNPHCFISLELMLPLSRFQWKLSSSFRSKESFPFVAVQVKLREGWFLIQGQKVFLAQKFTEGHIIKIGRDYKSSAFLLHLHSSIIKEQLAYEAIGNA